MGLELKITYNQFYDIKARLGSDMQYPVEELIEVLKKAGLSTEPRKRFFGRLKKGPLDLKYIAKLNSDRYIVSFQKNKQKPGYRTFRYCREFIAA